MESINEALEVYFDELDNLLLIKAREAIEIFMHGMRFKGKTAQELDFDEIEAIVKIMDLEAEICWNTDTIKSEDGAYKVTFNPEFKLRRRRDSNGI